MLSQRQLLILQAIVDDYVQSAEPIGSRSISKREDISFSPATIRNEMADLEEMGYLLKPHSSAGRIPSNKGYRLYVDHLLRPAPLQQHEILDMEKFFTRRISEVEAVMKKTAAVLSELTSYVSIVLGPEMEHTKLKQLQMLPLMGRQAIAILVTDSGHVEHRTFDIPEHMDSGELEKVVNILNEQLVDTPIGQWEEQLITETSRLLHRHVRHYEDMFGVLRDAFKTEKGDQVFYGGMMNLMMQPEFQDIDRVRMIFDWLDHSENVHALLSRSQEGLNVRIGRENDIEAFADLSMITATYSIDGSTVGTLGVIGPTRMEYERVIRLIRQFATGLSTSLTKKYRHDS
ncbi:heat-inducible transcriptional repressor HrcA [Salicibibacter halophilus]|uniref:Heat-inducible transcription repressor HrcA n=1 Tax=Salicibibacter halophilus TaxID=2502791 RepID=A0A514LD38_9BACI|nr:heat-inducible transcriptional repressor HrcA [Salicibibacter halophilus]QDI89763.1 heat-inducible transcriptional repressor HrcA [Salicibibacter halophilus]